MTAETGLSEHQEAIARLRELIDQQAARLGEVAGLLEELFDLLYEMEGDLKASRDLAPPAPAQVIELRPEAHFHLPSCPPSSPEDDRAG